MSTSNVAVTAGSRVETNNRLTRVPMNARWETWKRDVLFANEVKATTGSRVVDDLHRLESSRCKQDNHWDW